jgi:hypothetical protein
MSKQIIASPSNKKVSSLYKDIKRNNLILQPDFQRRFVWNNKHKEKFIDTILSGYPIPEIYVAQRGIDIDTIESEEVVVDGQQRLHTIIEYIDEPDNSKTFGNIVKKYKDLSKKEKEDFLGYLIVVRDLGDITADQIKEVFKRINSTQYALNSIELHNAVYDGEFIAVAKNILEEIEIAKLPFFSDSKISRMDDLLFVLLIMSTIQEGGYFVGDKYVEKYVAEFNEEYPEKDKIKNKIVDVFQYINDMNLLKDSLWMRKSCYFTLFVEIYKVFDELKGKESTLKRELECLELQVETDKNKNIDDNKYAQFYSYIYTGTNSRKARVERGNFIYREIIEPVKEL